MRILTGCVFAACVALAAPVFAQAPLPVEAYGRLPAVADAAISPDGSKIALAMNSDAGPSVVIYDLNARQRVFTARVPENQQLRGVGWADDAHATFLISRALAPGQVLPYYLRYRGSPRRVEFYRNGVVDVATQDTRLLTTGDEVWQDDGAVLVAPIEGDPGYGRMIGRALARDADHPTVFRVSFRTGRSNAVTPRGENADTFSYLLDERGNPLVRSDSDDRTNHWSIYVYDGETPRLLSDGVSEFGDPPAILGLLGDGRLAALDGDANSEFGALYAIDRVTGQRTPLVEKPGHGVDGVMRDPWTRRVVGVAWTEEEARQQFFDADLQSAYERVATLFRGGATIDSWSRDRARILVFAELGLDGGGYYIFTPADGHADRIFYRYPNVAAAQNGTRQALTYRARDGARIPAYLTLPYDAAHNLPLVVLVHGGPSVRDTMAFDWWSAFLASRGYVVLQPNYRGSGGYGATWEDAGHGEWGGRMQTDVEDGVGALARAGIIDPSRVCIVGGSYGGYAALAGATLTPDRYKCAVSVAGLSDLVSFVREREAQSGADSASSDYWRVSIGDRRDDGAHLRSVSPANLADRVQIPILLIHGTDDTVVPISQSRLMRDRLNAAHKNVRYVELQGDDHYLSDAPTRIQTLREIDAFLAEHLGRPATTPAQ